MSKKKKRSYKVTKKQDTPKVETPVKLEDVKKDVREGLDRLANSGDDFKVNIGKVIAKEADRLEADEKEVFLGDDETKELKKEVVGEAFLTCPVCNQSLAKGPDEMVNHQGDEPDKHHYTGNALKLKAKIGSRFSNYINA